MKPVLYSTIAALVMLAGLTTRAHSQTQQPLGDYARALKKEKSASAKSSKTYDNDTMPNTGTVSVVGAAAAESDNKDDAATNNAEAKGPEVKAGQSTEDREKALSEWKQRIDDQKGKVDLLSRELDVLQRERQVKQAEFYSSTARTVQNPRGFDEEDAKYKEKIADKQKALDDAKGKLNEMQEQATKAGVPSSVRE